MTDIRDTKTQCEECKNSECSQVGKRIHWKAGHICKSKDKKLPEFDMSGVFTPHTWRVVWSRSDS